jgi:hypothetical protein
VTALWLAGGAVAICAAGVLVTHALEVVVDRAIGWWEGRR